MAAWYEDLRARRERGAGSVDVYFASDGENAKPLSIPLRYPKGRDKERVGAMLDAIDAGDTGTAQALEQADKTMLAIVKACLVDAPPEDEDLIVLIRESGGIDGGLIKRCQTLLGINREPGGGGRVNIRPVKRGARR